MRRTERRHRGHRIGRLNVEFTRADREDVVVTAFRPPSMGGETSLPPESASDSDYELERDQRQKARGPDAEDQRRRLFCAVLHFADRSGKGAGHEPRR